MEAMTPPSLEHTLALASSLIEVLTMFMEEATKLRGRGVGEENKLIEAETLKDFIAEEGSESPTQGIVEDKLFTESEILYHFKAEEESEFSEQYNATITTELKITNGAVLDEDNLLKNDLNFRNDTDFSVPEKEPFGNKKRSQRINGKFKCEQCDYETRITQNSKMHKLYKHGERKIMCDQCHKKFFTNSHLKEHIKGVHGKGEQCSLCDFKTTCKRNIEKHIAITHFPKSLLCSECSFTTSDQSMLKAHINRLHTAKEDWPKCSDCDYTSSKNERVNTHVRKVHQQIKFKCIVCPSIFSESKNMHSHMQKIHKDVLIETGITRVKARFENKFVVRPNEEAKF